MTTPEPPVILKTRDYYKFKFIKYNRDLDKMNLNRLEKKTRQKFQMHLFPITVDEDLNIIDGQHRFTVCEKLDLPVYYIKATTLTKSIEDIGSVNLAGKRHTIKDKITMLIKSGDPHMLEVEQIYNEFEKLFDICLVARLVDCYGVNASSHTTTRIDDGTFDLRHKEDAVRLFNSLYNSTIKNSHKITFVEVIAKIHVKYGINPTELIATLQDRGFRITKGMRRGSLIKNLIDDWNYKKSARRIPVENMMY